MLSKKPYIIKAFYDWIVDSKCTPLVIIDATTANCEVPQHFVERGQIVLNIAPESIRDFMLNYRKIEFRASFGGVVYFISVPITAILGIYAKENNEGMSFEFDDETDTDATGTGENVAATLFVVEDKYFANKEHSASELGKSKVAYLQLVE